MSNLKAEKFRKRGMQEAALQAQANADTLDTLRQIVSALSVNAMEQGKRLAVVTDVANRSNQRTLDQVFQVQAMAELLGLTWDQVEARAVKLREAETDRYNEEQDKEQGLEVVTDIPAELGMTAIVSVSCFKEGKELEENRVVKARVEVGKGELLPEIDQAVVGLKSGESKRFALNVQDKTDEVEVRVLGLRRKPQPAAVATETATPSDAPSSTTEQASN